MSGDCLFCHIIAGDKPASFVYRDESVVAFLDINQASPGHTLVVPYTHVEHWWQLNDSDAAAIAIAAKPLMRALCTAMEPDGINILQNNGAAAGQSVYHVHFHLIPRWHGDERIGKPPEYAARNVIERRAVKIRAALDNDGVH